MDIGENLAAIRDIRTTNPCSKCGRVHPDSQFYPRKGGTAKIQVMVATWELSRILKELQNWFLLCPECKEAKENEPKMTVKERNRKMIVDHKATHPCIKCGLISNDNWLMSPSGNALPQIQKYLNNASIARMRRELDGRVVMCESCGREEMKLRFGPVTINTIKKVLRDNALRIEYESMVNPDDVFARAKDNSMEDLLKLVNPE
jgi:Zn finger protein HypA/HybF involved in hydrogenase expression